MLLFFRCCRIIRIVKVYCNLEPWLQYIIPNGIQIHLCVLYLSNDNSNNKKRQHQQFNYDELNFSNGPRCCVSFRFSFPSFFLHFFECLSLLPWSPSFFHELFLFITFMIPSLPLYLTVLVCELGPKYNLPLLPQ